MAPAVGLLPQPTAIDQGAVRGVGGTPKLEVMLPKTAPDVQKGTPLLATVARGDKTALDAQKGTPFTGDLSQETKVLRRTDYYTMKLTIVASAFTKPLEPLAIRVHGPRDLDVTTSSAAVVDLVEDTMATFVDDGLPTRTSTTHPLHEGAIPS